MKSPFSVSIEVEQAPVFQQPWDIKGVQVNKPYAEEVDPSTGQLVDVIKKGVCEAGNIPGNTLTPIAGVKGYPGAND